MSQKYSPRNKHRCSCCKPPASHKQAPEPSVDAPSYKHQQHPEESPICVAPAIDTGTPVLKAQSRIAQHKPVLHAPIHSQNEVECLNREGHNARDLAHAKIAWFPTKPCKSQVDFPRKSFVRR